MEAGGVNGPRRDGAEPIKGVSRSRQGVGSRNFSNLNAFYARQRGAPSSDNPAFAGMTPEDVAVEMARHGETTSFGGDEIVPDTRLPPRVLREETARRAAGGGGKPDAPSPLSGPGNDIPLSPTGGYVKPTLPNGNTPVEGDPFGTGLMPMGDNNPFSPPNTPPPAAAPSADPTAPRQSVGKIDPENTPAHFRGMARDAEMGRSVNTMGTPGLADSAIPGGRPTQAADFRRLISSKYGTGTNVARLPGQGPATTTDLMGRPTTMKDYAEERRAVQRSKNQIPDEEEDESIGSSEETQEAA